MVHVKIIEKSYCIYYRNYDILFYMKKIKYHFTNIKWDTDGRSSKKLKLPRHFIFETTDLEFDPENEGADILSDKFGYCVFSFEFKKIE